MAVDHDERVERSAHLGYEKVVLSQAAVEELGQRLSDEDRKRGTVAMSGRKGLGVKVDDLIDQLELGALSEVSSRHPDLSQKEQKATAQKIAVAALRYFLLKYTRNSIISFDFKEALALKGETGPYIQYSVTRVNSIFRKLKDAGIDYSANTIDSLPADRLNQLLGGEDGDDLWSLIYLATRLPETIRGAVAALEPAILAKWTFQLAQRFSLFYDNPRNHLLSEADADRRALLIAIAKVVRRQLLAALEILGMEAPERM
jgi:arginyl-tRNA synthetase